jgi:hypothetical protein
LLHSSQTGGGLKDISVRVKNTEEIEECINCHNSSHRWG